MPLINFEAKTDRELLLLVAQKSNEVAEMCPKCQDRIATLESRSRYSVLGISGGIFTVLAGITYGVASAFGWKGPLP